MGEAVGVGIGEGIGSSSLLGQKFEFGPKIDVIHSHGAVGAIVPGRYSGSSIGANIFCISISHSVLKPL
jgi:hypothetical protein